MKKTEAFEAFTEQQKADLDALEARPDGSVDTSDIPEILDWSGGKRGLFYRPPQREAVSRSDIETGNGREQYRRPRRRVGGAG